MYNGITVSVQTVLHYDISQKSYYIFGKQVCYINRRCYYIIRQYLHHQAIILTSRVPVEGKSSVSLICMKYRMIILIINIISLGQILLSYIANTSRTHACTRVRTHAHPPTAVTAVQVVAIQWVGRSTVTARSAGDNAGRLPLKYTLATVGRFPRGFGCFSRIKNSRPN